MKTTAVAAALAVVLTVVLVGVFAEDNAVQEALKTCKKTSNLNATQLYNTCEGTLPTNEEELKAYKCFCFCVQKLVGIMDENGAINAEHSAHLVNEKEKEEMKAIATECKGEVNGKGVFPDLCDKAFSVDQCYSSKNKGMYQKNCKFLIDTISA